MPFDLKLFCNLALQHNMITQQQLAEVLKAPDAQGGKVGEALVARNWISREQYDWLVKAEAYYRAQQAQQAQPTQPVQQAQPASQPQTAATAKRPTNLEQRQELAEIDVSGETPLELDSASVAHAGTSGGARAAYRAGHDAETEHARQDAGMAAAVSAAAAAVSTPSAHRPAPAVATQRPMAHAAKGPEAERVHSFLQMGIQLGASDVHLHATLPPMVRVMGHLQPLPGQQPLSAADMEPMARALLDDKQWKQFSTKWDLDFAYEVAGLGRFRSNAYRQQRGVDLVFRLIPPKPPTLQELGLPKELAHFMDFHQGLILCTGPAGCGKSTTMAALLDIVNESRSDHILTIEDPVEFIHRSKKCLVRQRQVNTHTESFARALRGALREDPDVIAIGELRDLETIQLALSAAETGHLVIGTLHTNSAIRTINRVLDVFPPDQQAQIRVMFSESLRGVISQKLVPRADGKGRVPALEVLMVNHAVGNLIRDEKQFQIRSIMQMSKKSGMRLLDDSLKDLVRANIVKKEDAKLAAENPASLDGGAPIPGQGGA